MRIQHWVSDETGCRVTTMASGDIDASMLLAGFRQVTAEQQDVFMRERQDDSEILGKR